MLRIFDLISTCVFLGAFIVLHAIGPNVHAQSFPERMGERARAIEVKTDAVQADMKRLEDSVIALQLRLAAQESHSNQVTGMGIALGGIVVIMQFLQMVGVKKKSGDG